MAVSIASGIGVDAADDVAVQVQRVEELAAAAVDFEDPRAGADIKGLGDVLRQIPPGSCYGPPPRELRRGRLLHYLSRAAMLIVAVSIATDATFVPSGTRNGNRALVFRDASRHR